MLGRIWEWLRASDNRGALQLVLQYGFGPFSVLGLALAGYYFLTRPAEYDFSVKAFGGDTLSTTEERIEVTVQNEGRKDVWLGNEIICWGLRGGEAQDGIYLSLKTQGVTVVPPGPPVSVKFRVVDRSSYYVSESGAIMIDRDFGRHVGIFGREWVQSANCTIALLRPELSEVFEFNVRPTSQNTLGFIPNMRDDFIYSTSRR